MGCLPWGDSQARSPKKYKVIEPSEAGASGVPGVSLDPVSTSKSSAKVAPEPPLTLPPLTPRGAAKVVRLQAVWRGASSRNARRRDHTMQTAVQLVQSTLRRHAAKKKFLTVVEQARRHKAASRLQRTWRQQMWRRHVLRREQRRPQSVPMLKVHRPTSGFANPKLHRTSGFDASDEWDALEDMSPVALAASPHRSGSSAAKPPPAPHRAIPIEEQLKLAIETGKWSLLRDLFAELQGVGDEGGAPVSSRPIWADLDQPDSPRDIGFANRGTRTTTRKSAKSRCLTAGGSVLIEGR